MLFSDSYFTISAPAEATVKEKGSKFIAHIFPVTSEKEIKEQLQSLKKIHPSANHHCYAWRLGADKAAYRSSDDGEPANTAGKPILSQIQQSDLTNVLLVVIRYFGGTLLGVGGLIQAYRLSAKEAIAAAAIEERFILFEYEVVFGFDDMNAVMRLLKEFDAKIIFTSYEAPNKIIFKIKKQNSEKLEKKFSDLYTCQLGFLKMI